MELYPRLYFGTWGLAWTPSSFDYNHAKSLISSAWRSGVTRFDTAYVYGDGEIEKLLGETLPSEAHILTKVPAVKQLNKGENVSLEDAYPLSHIESVVEQSRSRLNKEVIQTLLLHNWSIMWNFTDSPVFDYLYKLKSRGWVDRIGISLPNGFQISLPQSVLEHVAVIEAPYNPLDSWIINDIERYHWMGKEVLLRSLFLQGFLTKPLLDKEVMASIDVRSKYREKEELMRDYSIEELLFNALSLKSSVVIGMNADSQIEKNLTVYMKGVSDESR